MALPPIDLDAGRMDFKEKEGAFEATRGERAEFIKRGKRWNRSLHRWLEVLPGALQYFNRQNAMQPVGVYQLHSGIRVKTLDDSQVPAEAAARDAKCLRITGIRRKNGAEQGHIFVLADGSKELTKWKNAILYAATVNDIQGDGSDSGGEGGRGGGSGSKGGGSKGGGGGDDDDDDESEVSVPSWPGEDNKASTKSGGKAGKKGSRADGSHNVRFTPSTDKTDGTDMGTDTGTDSPGSKQKRAVRGDTLGDMDGGATPPQPSEGGKRGAGGRQSRQAEALPANHPRSKRSNQQQLQRVVLQSARHLQGLPDALPKDLFDGPDTPHNTRQRTAASIRAEVAQVREKEREKSMVTHNNVSYFSSLSHLRTLTLTLTLTLTRAPHPKPHNRHSRPA